MRTETEVKVDGMKALIHALGEVQAEQFVSAVMQERFDYTAWRATGLPDMSAQKVHEAALLRGVARKYLQTCSDDGSSGSKMTRIATCSIAAPAGNTWARARFGLKRHPVTPPN